MLSALYYVVAFRQLTPGRDADTASLRIMMLDVIERLARLQQHVAARQARRPRAIGPDTHLLTALRPVR
ncbi:hypothetical protein AB0883_21155 [Micromonospora sp. NPDC047812]|uniref:hypothetical protein n=1 Tax=Micromonospora sp. NPDC047812 TaxID=3155742 RepID=UPI0034543CCB